MPNKTISIPDDVIPVIETLGMPFSRWVAEQLRRHAAESSMSFGDQLLADADLSSNDERPNKAAVAERLGQSAPW